MFVLCRVSLYFSTVGDMFDCLDVFGGPLGCGLIRRFGRCVHPKLSRNDSNKSPKYGTTREGEREGEERPIGREKEGEPNDIAPSAFTVCS